jgi:hypothetical protein
MAKPGTEPDRSGGLDGLLFRAFPGLMSSRIWIFGRPSTGGGVATHARQNLIPINALGTFFSSLRVLLRLQKNTRKPGTLLTVLAHYRVGWIG